MSLLSFYNPLTHSFPMYPFSTPLKTSENLAVEKGCIENEWVKISENLAFITFLGLLKGNAGLE